MSDTKPQIQETERTVSRINIRTNSRTTCVHTLFKREGQRLGKSRGKPEETAPQRERNSHKNDIQLPGNRVGEESGVKYRCVERENHRPNIVDSEKLSSKSEDVKPSSDKQKQRDLVSHIA